MKNTRNLAVLLSLCVTLIGLVVFFYDRTSGAVTYFDSFILEDSEDFLSTGYVYETEGYEGGYPIRVVLVAGMHGNEPAGVNFLEESQMEYGEGFMAALIIPRLNGQACLNGVRFTTMQQDFNRTFLRGDGSGTDRYLSRVLEYILDFEPDLVIDLHETAFDDIKDSIIFSGLFEEIIDVADLLNDDVRLVYGGHEGSLIYVLANEYGISSYLIEANSEHVQDQKNAVYRQAIEVIVNAVTNKLE